MKRFFLALSIVVLGSIAAVSAQGAKRPISLVDLGRLKEVRDPQCAPDGKSVAYVVSQIDVKEDKAGNGHIWMVGLDGQNERQITSSTDSESSPKFSPDGKYLSFTSSRPGKAKGNQVWLLDRSRRRSVSAHRDQRPAAGLRMVARLEAAGTDDWRSGS